MRKQEGWKPKFLIDQNIALKPYAFMKELGLDVKSLADLGLKGRSDQEIVLAAKNEDRILITFDKDFGAIYYFSERGKVTIIILSLDDQTSENVNSVLHKFVSHADLAELRNKLTILYQDRIRVIEYQ